ncbi:MAG: hypothetical protein ACLQDM_01720 [Bradyrhizobium sp.]
MASTSRLGDQFVGQNVTSIVTRFGKPISRSKTDNDQTSYVWDLDDSVEPAVNHRIQAAAGGLYGDGETPGYMTDDPRFCKMTVTVSREGIVTQVVAEEQNGTGAPSVSLGFNGSICAQRLRAKPQT